MSDKEVGDILEFVSRHVATLKAEGGEKHLKDIALEWGLSPPQLCQFKGYNRDSDPHFRTTYKFLRGILGYSPIELSTCPYLQVFKQLRESEDWEIVKKFLEIYNHKDILRRRIYFAVLAFQIDEFYKELEIIKDKKAV